MKQAVAEEPIELLGRVLGVLAAGHREPTTDGVNRETDSVQHTYNAVDKKRFSPCIAPGNRYL